MEENGNKGIGSLPIIILLISALLSAACAILGATGIFSNHPVYNDPELSVSLVRGNILDRNGNYLAIQAPDYGFYITMNDSSASECAAFISMWTEENAISIEEKIRNGKIFIPITIIPSSDERAAIYKALDEYGLSDDLDPVSIEKRKYPLGYHAYNITGRTNSRLEGISGIEFIYDEELSPVPSIYSVIATGSDITTTIDSLLQYRISSFDGKAAILSPDNEILAYSGSAENETLMAICGEYSAVDAMAEERLSPIPLEGGYVLYAEDESYAPYAIEALVEEGFIEKPEL